MRRPAAFFLTVLLSSFQSAEAVKSVSTMKDANVEQFKQLFNGSAADTRVVALLSPT